MIRCFGRLRRQGCPRTIQQFISQYDTRHVPTGGKKMIQGGTQQTENGATILERKAKRVTSSVRIEKMTFEENDFFLHFFLLQRKVLEPRLLRKVWVISSPCFAPLPDPTSLFPTMFPRLIHNLDRSLEHIFIRERYSMIYVIHCSPSG